MINLREAWNAAKDLKYDVVLGVRRHSDLCQKMKMKQFKVVMLRHVTYFTHLKLKEEPARVSRETLPFDPVPI